MKHLFAFAIVLFAAPSWGWEFMARPVCTIFHATESAQMQVTYDPSQALPYTITVTLMDGAWGAASPYAIAFSGTGFTITTDRHKLGEDGRSVAASDTGFGNVLRGLAGGGSARAMLGARSVEVPLQDAAAAVARFRECARPGMS